MSSTIEQVEMELNDATSRAWTLVRSTDPRLFTVRPDPASWSAAECLAHLTIASQLFVEPLRAGIDRARAGGARAREKQTMDVVGRVLRWFMEPPIRSKVQTVAPLVPRSIRPKSEAFGEFASHQDKLIELLRAGREVNLSSEKIVSPFDIRVRYNLFSAFRILAAHQRRHLWQAEQAVAALRSHREP